MLFIEKFNFSSFIFNIYSFSTKIESDVYHIIQQMEICLNIQVFKNTFQSHVKSTNLIFVAC